jgi:hypothetical protein
MSGLWTENGPISLPSRPLAYAAGLAVIAFAVMSGSLGFQASFRKAPGVDAAVNKGAHADNAVAARPIVDLSPTPAAPPAGADTPDDVDSSNAKADDQVDQAPATQAVPAAQPPTGDAAAEKSAEPAKSPDETGPAPPVKSEVPF